MSSRIWRTPEASEQRRSPAARASAGADRTRSHSGLRTAAICLASALCAPAALAADRPPSCELRDAHVHLTNYVQEGPSAREFLAVMSQRVGRAVLFGIPLQQTWSHENSGEFAPTYYLQTDAPLYYYSFTDAQIALQYLALSAEERARFDPMITGFNPADMYAVDHIRRVLRAFPGVFSGIGEFSIHKEFVSAKVAGEVASLRDPALDRILRFAGEVGLVVLIHNDMDVPFAAPGAPPVYLAQMLELLRRHPGTTVIWAHMGLGRVIHPVTAAPPGSTPTALRAHGEGHAEILARILADPGLAHVYFDLSWDEVAKYVVASAESLSRSAQLIERYPDRFLFGTDAVSPGDAHSYLAVFEQYRPLWERLQPASFQKLCRRNYERLFDAARARVRAWERTQPD